MTDKPRDYTEELNNATVRIDHLVWLPSLVATDFPADVPACKAFIEDALDGFIKIESLPELGAVLELQAEENMKDDEFAEELVSRLACNRRNGFLAKVATPYTFNHRDNGYSLTWGHYKAKWIYAETVDDLTNQAVAWAEAEHEKDRASEAEKKTATAQELI